MEKKTWYTYSVEYRPLQKFLKEAYQNLSDEEKEHLKILGFSLRGTYTDLVDSYRLLQEELDSPIKHFRHKLLMTTVNPLDEVVENMLRLAEERYNKRNRLW